MLAWEILKKGGLKSNPDQMDWTSIVVCLCIMWCPTVHATNVNLYYVQLLYLCIIMCTNQSEVVDKCAIVVSVYNVVFMQPMQPKDRTWRGMLASTMVFGSLWELKCCCLLKWCCCVWWLSSPQWCCLAQRWQWWLNSVQCERGNGAVCWNGVSFAAEKQEQIDNRAWTGVDLKWIGFSHYFSLTTQFCVFFYLCLCSHTHHPEWMSRLLHDQMFVKNITITKNITMRCLSKTSAAALGSLHTNKGSWQFVVSNLVCVS